MSRLEQFMREPAPLDMATFKKPAEYCPGKIASNLAHAQDNVRASFAEKFDLHANKHPDGSRNGYHVDLTVNIPLKMEGDKPGDYDMVFRSSGCLPTYAYNY